MANEVKTITPKFIVADMVPANIDALLKIEQTSEENFWPKGQFEKHATGPRYCGLVAYSENNPVGFLCYEKKAEESEFQIWNMVVADSHRRQMAGTTMVSYLTMLMQPNYSSIVFNVRESNVTAQLFLKKLGFWCDTIARNYFLDKIKDDVRRENAYRFDYNPNKKRSKDAKIRITSRFGNVIARPRTGARASKAPGGGVDVSLGDRHRQGKA